MKIEQETDEHVRRWIRSVDALEDLKKDISRRETEICNACNALAKHLLPDDAELNEVITIPYYGGYLEVLLPSTTAYEEGTGIQNDVPASNHVVRWRGGRRPAGLTK